MRTCFWRCMILSCLSVVLVACGTSATTPQTTEVSPTATPGTSGPARVEGRVIAESDVTGQPDEPLVDQRVVAIPRAALEDVAADDASLRFLTLELASLPAGAETTVTGDEGAYRLDLPPGDYALCLAYPAGDSDSDPPYLIRGCGPLTLAPGAERTIDISSGFGEIQLIDG